MKVTDQMKGLYYSGKEHRYLQDKTFAMLFFAGSTRTRMSFETGMTQLGGHSQFLNPQTMRLSLEDKPGAGGDGQGHREGDGTILRRNGHPPS